MAATALVGTKLLTCRLAVWALCTPPCRFTARAPVRRSRRISSELVRNMATASASADSVEGSQKVTAPYGSWKSPITADVVCGAEKRLGGFDVAGDGGLVWVETRPTEAGYTMVH